MKLQKVSILIAHLLILDL